MGAGPRDNPALSSEQQRRVSEILTAALDMDAESTETLVSSAGAGDRDVEAAILRALTDRHSAATPAYSAHQVLAGRYRILRFIGRGGMGEVYEARDLELNERIALKTLRPDIASDHRMVSRFKQEIHLARQITHPNICRIYDISHHAVPAAPDSTVLFLTMEFLEGETLASRLNRTGRMTTGEAAPLVRQMAEGLDAAHRAGVIHRDFKPANVMLVPEGQAVRAVITDFGLARNVRPGPADQAFTAVGTIVGTLDYMAPELLTSGVASPASDLYALGLVMYLMVTGVRPFPEETPMAGAIRRAKDPIPSPRQFAAGLDAAWERAILRCLEPMPEQRFSTAAELLETFDHPASAPRRRLPGRKRIAGVVAAAALAAVLTGSPWLRRGPSSEAREFYNRGTDQLQAGANFAATKALAEATRLAPNYTMAHARLAAAWLELELPEKASQEMLLARRNQGPSLTAGERLYIDAIDLTLTREFEAASQKFEAVLKRAGDADAIAHLDLGVSYERAQHPQKARAEYTRATQVRSIDAAPWLRLAILRSQAADWDAGDAAFNKAEQLYQTTSNLEGITEVAYQRGVAANRHQRLDDAGLFLRKALATSLLTRNVHEELRAKLTLANMAFLGGDSSLAQRYATEAVETARANHMDSLVTRGLLNLGNALVRRRDFAGAEIYYREGLTLATRSGSHRLEAFALLALSSLHSQLGRATDAAAEVQQAFTFFSRNNFARESIQSLVLLGRAQRDQGVFTAALDSFNRAAAISASAKDASLGALSHESVGSLEYELQNYPKALTEYQESLRLYTDKEHQGYAAIHCGQIFWQLGRYAEAQQMFQTAEVYSAGFPTLAMELMRSRAEALLSQGRFQEARSLLRQALAGLKDQSPATTADLKRSLGAAEMALGDVRLGLRTSNEAYQLAIASHNPFSRTNAALDLLGSRVASADWKGAVELWAAEQNTVSRFPESHWRALALVAIANRSLGRGATAWQIAHEAHEQTGALSAQWGAPAFQLYLSRPDIRKLWRALQSAPIT